MPRMASMMLLIAITVSAASVVGEEMLSKYKLQVDRFGPVIVGMAPDEASKKLGTPLILGRPTDEDDSACHYVYPEGKKYGDIGFMVENGRISRIDVHSGIVATSSAIHVGDNESVVKNAYPGNVEETVHPYLGKNGKYLTVEAKPGYAFIFETERGRIITFRSGKLGSVKYIEGCQ